jgi:hypothetical protein
LRGKVGRVGVAQTSGPGVANLVSEANTREEVGDFYMHHENKVLDSGKRSTGRDGREGAWRRAAIRIHNPTDSSDDGTDTIEYIFLDEKLYHRLTVGDNSGLKLSEPVRIRRESNVPGKVGNISGSLN